MGFGREMQKQLELFRRWVRISFPSFNIQNFQVEFYLGPF